ncbi:MAG TPA: glycosyltransferase family 4 protein [Gaiellaceae bacterium]|jgi:phosphatidylinositol alpha-mannosyltransferase|nr:glycosyltransferase family 4 protein [Gaiellaceae bacterium]
MKIGIVVPFSWSYWGGVVEHAEHQAAALRRRGHDVRIVMGNDPPGKFTRFLHPRSGRHGPLPDGIIAVGRSVVVPANGSLPNIILSPRTVGRVRRVLEIERFDVLHLHEPMTPAICVATLAIAQCPIVATHHAQGELGWMKMGLKFWGFLMDRIDARIAVSPIAAESARRWIPDDYRVIPNGVLIPPEANPADRDHTVVFVGRHDPRKGLAILLRAWPEIHAATGARLRLIGTDPLQYRLLHARLRFDESGIDVLGIVPNEVRTHELERAKVFVSPALGGESFGLVVAEALACATPAVASDIPGYAAVATPETSRLVPPGDPDALAAAVIDVLSDEERRVEMGRAARAHAVANYAWDDIARRLEEVYVEVCA